MTRNSLGDIWREVEKLGHAELSGPDAGGCYYAAVKGNPVFMCSTWTHTTPEEALQQILDEHADWLMRRSN